MKHPVLLLVLLLALPVLLAACTQTTALKFTNATECGTANITLTNTNSGNIREYTVAEGESREIEIDPNVPYRYTVEYPRMTGAMQCDTKNVTTMLEKGQTVNVRLESELDESLQNATATAEAETSSAE